ncbi:MAG: winged helix-turn-helix domain-containing protein [Actinomycetota bacterium]|nr:winged helix-turn-helix domain-containing protein [Actinomycetota bacterium]
MEIRVLGPVEVVLEGRVRSAPSGGERELLALLALSARRVVPTANLVDALWGEELPANPSNALQVRVSKLRRALDKLGMSSALIVTRPPGYLLDLDREHVDALRFTDLITSARAVADMDPTGASELYRDALSMWRGEALSEFADSAWARPEMTRMVELQLAAREELIDLDLAAGRHADVLAELEALSAAYPLRERLYGRLMLALYRTGRQADALAAYQRARAMLDAELGLEPSTELRGLQESILQQSPELSAPARTAPGRTSAPLANRLPTRLTSFFGRDEDLDRIGALLHAHRLVTVTGPGGVGKTSIAVEVARRATSQFPDGVAFARLSGVADPAQLPHAVLAALDVRDVATSTAEEQLVGHLRERHVLLVLDNCEHLADACAVLTERLLESCPQLRLLPTSREPLAARGEVQYAVSPLTIPPTDAGLTDLTDNTAVQLFVDRAQSALPAFRLGDDNAAAIAEICRQLDGIPLAIELAAARVFALPVEELASRMGDRFALLTTGSRTAEARQRTLRAAIDWSHDLLTESERVLLRRLSVFRGAWTLEGVQVVCGGDDHAPGDIVDTLARLVEKSLVVIDRDAGRYHLLETIREYARERLSEANESEPFGAAHVRYLTSLAERAERDLRADGQSRWLRRLSDERDDIEAALAWCTAHADAEPDQGLRLVGALGWYWYFASRPDGGHKVAAMLAATPAGSQVARAGALQALAVAARPGACIVHPAPDCAAAAAESRALFTQVGDKFRAALSTTLLAVEGIGGHDPAAAFNLLIEADDEFHRVDDAWCSALVQFVQMELHAAAGAMSETTSSGNRALAVFRRLGDQWGVSAIQFHLGMAMHRWGRLDEARAFYEGALSSGREVGPANTIQYALAGAGHVALELGEAERAASLFTQSNEIARQLGAVSNPRAVVGEGLLARERADLTASRAHLLRAQQMLAGKNEPDWTATTLIGLGHLAELSGDLDSAQFSHRLAWETAGHPGALEGMACVRAARGQASDAARLLGAANWWREARHRPLSRLERVDVERAEDRARVLLGDDSFQAAYGGGTAEPHAVVDGLEAISTGV